MEGDKAKEFIARDKYWLTAYICLAHAVAIIFQEMGNVLVKNEYKIAGGICVLVTVFVYVFVLFVVQTGIIFEECRVDIVDQS